MSQHISALLVVLGLLTTAGPAWACAAAEKDMMFGNVAHPMIMTTTNGLTEVRQPIWDLRGDLAAGGVGFIRLGLMEDGDRWEAAPEDENDLAKWWTTPIRGKEYGGTGLKVRVLSKNAGTANIPLRYIPAHGEVQDVTLKVSATPPPPPPEPPTLTVEGETFKGNVPEYRTFQILLTAPLPPGYRWEVKEAVYHDPHSGEGGKWLPIEVVAREGETGLFMASTRGDAARIVFVQKSDGWQLFPDTKTKHEFLRRAADAEGRLD